MAKIITENFKVETTNELYNSFKNRNELLGTQFETELTTLNDGTLSNVLSASNIQEIKTLVDNQLQSLRPEAEYYIMASRALSSVEGLSPITNTQKDKRDFQRKVIFGNKVDTDSSRYMFYENAWIPGTVYDAYDDTKDIEGTNSIVSIRNSDDDYLVFKCIENNNNGPSTSSPQSVIAELASAGYQSVETSDKYIWHYMFTVVASEANIYKTSNSLPLPASGGDEAVIANAKECVSQIVIETTPVNHFSQFVFDLGVNSSLVTVTEETPKAGSTIKTVSLRVANSQVISSVNNFYTNMYLRASGGSNAGKLYEVLSSTSDSGTSNINVDIDTEDDLSDQCELVPKIQVSNPEVGGIRARAYGIINKFGTLARVGYETKGTKYKFATATAVNPTGLSDNSITELRVVVSPSGGHGSNPANELAMSRLCIVTNFSGESPTVPSTNYYTQVGLVKNPNFKSTTGSPQGYITSEVPPSSFDNRTSFLVSGDQRDNISQGDYVEQFVETVPVTSKIANTKYIITDLGNLDNSEWQSMMGVDPNTDLIDGKIQVGVVFVANSADVDATKTGLISTVIDGFSDEKDLETVKGHIHEVEYRSASNDTKIYVVDNNGDHRSNFLPGKITVKTTALSQSGNILTINNFIDIEYGPYVPYSGELLHYIDFSPIQRKEITKEKIKFLFDF